MVNQLYFFQNGRNNTGFHTQKDDLTLTDQIGRRRSRHNAELCSAPFCALRSAL